MSHSPVPPQGPNPRPGTPGHDSGRTRPDYVTRNVIMIAVVILACIALPFIVVSMVKSTQSPVDDDPSCESTDYLDDETTGYFDDDDDYGFGEDRTTGFGFDDETTEDLYGKYRDC